MKALSVQKFLIGLSKNAPLKGMISAAYDSPPEQPSFSPPFMSVGDISSMPTDTKTGLGFTHTVNLNVWGRKSRAEVRAITETLYDLLHGKSFVLDSGATAEFYLTRDMTLVEPDKITFRSVGVYRVVVNPNQ